MSAVVRRGLQEVEIDAPEFPRHDQENGMRYTEAVFVRFEDVELKDS